MKFYITKLLIFTIMFFALACSNKGIVVVYDAPEGEKRSDDYRVWVNDKEVFCYEGQVYDTRFTEGRVFGENGLPYSTVTFGYFDFSGKVEVKVEVKNQHEVDSANIRPLSTGIEPVVNGNTILFKIRKPGSFTIEPNGSEKRVLHLFANPLMERPDPDEENLIYFGPGKHVVNTIRLMDNQTLFVDGGAVLYFDAFEDDTVYRIETRNNDEIHLKRYDHGIEAIGAKNIKIKGRGILDFSRIVKKNGRKNPIHINNCENVDVEGIILRDANCWHATFYRSKNVLIDNIKEIARGFNSDGINIVLSQHVHIKNCFLRQRDDGIVMKAMDTGNKDAFIDEVPRSITSTSDVLVEDCVIWSDWGYALGVTYEVRMPVHDITFRNCDIIHATHKNNNQGVLGILVADKDVCSDVLFEDIRVERCLKPLIRIDTRYTKWTVSETLGNIKNITFRNVQFEGKLDPEQNPIIIKGRSDSSTVRDITFNHVYISGDLLESTNDWNFITNEYVKGIQFK